MTPANKSIALIGILLLIILALSYLVFFVQSTTNEATSPEDSETLDDAPLVAEGDTESTSPTDDGAVESPEANAPEANSPEADPVMCTADVKQCPDGSYVSRTGPNCAFAACPPYEPPDEPVFCTADVKECPDGTYVSRVAPSCNFAACPAAQLELTPPVIACPADAKLCPDGSAVGREGPNCEFAACPVVQMQLQL